MNEIDQGLDAIMSRTAFYSSTIFTDAYLNLVHDFRPDLEEYLDELEFSKVRTMESLIRWNDANYNPELSPGRHLNFENSITADFPKSIIDNPPFMML